MRDLDLFSASCVFLPVLLAGLACQRAQAPAPRPPHSAVDGAEDPTIEIRNVALRVTPHARLEVGHLLGQTVRTDPEKPVFFDEPASFAVRIEEADVALSPESLSALLNEWVFAYQGAPLRELEAKIEGDRLRLHGKLRKPVPVPFTVEGTVAATDDGNVRFTPTAIRAAGVPVGGLMDLLDLEMVELIHAEEARGVRLEGNDILLLTRSIAPPPAILGRVVAVELEGGRLRQRLGPPAEAPSAGPRPARPGDPDRRNYLFFHGGVVRFGKLTMDPADLQIADSDPDDPFDFYLARLKEQLVAGRSFTLADDGLLTVIPDHDDLEKREPAAAPGGEG